MYEIGEICFGGYLCVVSMWDIRKREIPVWLIAAGGILSASLGYFHGKIPLVLMVTGALVGGVFLLISRLTQEAFGYGDSLMIAVTGVYLGFWNVLYLLVWAYVLAAVFAGTAMAAEERTKITSIELIIDSDVQVGDESGDVSVTTNGSNYSIEDVEIVNDNGEWNSGDVPQVAITLEADSDYYFGSMSSSRVKLRGQSVLPPLWMGKGRSPAGHSGGFFLLQGVAYLC